MRINLLPYEYRPQPLVDSKRILFMILGSVLLFASLFTAFYCYLQFSNTEQALNSANDQWDSMKSEKQKIDQAEQRMAEIQKVQDEVNNIKKLYPEYSRYLNGFANSLVDELWLMNIQFAPGKIDVKGNSMSFAIIGDLLRNLDKQSFKTIRLSQVSQQTTETVEHYEFDINIEIQGGGVEYAQK